MKVLSLRQPWAYAVMRMGKNVENRSWKTNYRGSLLIHASKKIYREDVRAFRQIVDQNNLERPQDFYQKSIYQGFIGYVQLVDVRKDWQSIWSIPGQFHWILRNPILFDKPIPCKGQLGLWQAPPLKELQEQLIKYSPLSLSVIG